MRRGRLDGERLQVADRLPRWQHLGTHGVTYQRAHPSWAVVRALTWKPREVIQALPKAHLSITGFRELTIAFNVRGASAAAHLSLLLAGRADKLRVCQVCRCPFCRPPGSRWRICQWCRDKRLPRRLGAWRVRSAELRLYWKQFRQRQNQRLVRERERLRQSPAQRREQERLEKKDLEEKQQALRDLEKVEREELELDTWRKRHLEPLPRGRPPKGKS